MSRSRPVPFLLASFVALAALPGQRPADGMPHQLRDRVLGAHGGFVDADGTIRGEGANYRATFAGAAALEVASGEVSDPVAELRLRYTEARRGAARLPRDAAAQPTLAGEIVRWQHGPVTETYTLQPGGFEQSFVFAERPTGDGDLVVEIAASGNVTAPATERAAHQPIEWRHDDRSAIRYGEAFALDRSGQRIAIATAYDGDGRIELIVPAAFVDTAELPLVVDPGVGFTLLPAGSNESDTQPDVTYDPTSDRYLFVWRRAFASGATGIRGAVYTGDGAVVNPLIDIATSGTFAHEVREPCACLLRSLDPDGFVVAWTDENNNPGTVSDGIRARVLNSLGNPLAPAIAVNSSTAPQDSKPTISGPDGAIMIAWQSLTTAGQSSIRLRDLHWTNPFDPTAVTMGPDRAIYIAPTGQQARNPRLARSNARHMLGSIPLSANRLVWERYYPTPAPGHTDVWTTSFYLDATSLLTAQAPTVVPGADQAGVNESAPDIGSMGLDWNDAASMLFLVAWADNADIRAQRYSISGPIGSNIVVRATPNNEGSPAVAAGQTEWTVGYLELPVGAALDLDVYAAHVKGNGTVASDHNLVDAPGVVLQSGLRAASQPLPIAGQFNRNATMFAWSGRTGPASGIDDIRARRFEPIAGGISPWGFACQGPGGTLPTIGTVGGGPTPGTPGWAVTLSNAPPNSLAVLVFGNDPIDVPIGGTNNCRLYTNLPFLTMLPAFTSPSGSAQIALPVPVGIPLFPWQMQWGVETPGWNGFGWISSDDLDVYFTE